MDKASGMLPVEQSIGRTVSYTFCASSPGSWHRTTKGGHYIFSKPPEWLQEALPTLKKMLQCLKLCPSPTAKATAEIASSAANSWNEDLKLTEELVAFLSTKSRDQDDQPPDVTNGAALRAMRRLLQALDPDRKWGDLRKVLTPEGHWLWLCEEHARAYRR